MLVNRTGNESGLVNVGNVKLKVAKNEEGVLIGHIVLEPEESEKIEDDGEYIGGQDE